MPWEWDVKRMAASVEIAGRDIGLAPERRRWLVSACVREYREGMAGFAAESHLNVWYDRLHCRRRATAAKAKYRRTKAKYHPR